MQEEEENTDCWHCGPVTKYDFEFDNRDQDDSIALQIIENFSAALSGARTLPYEFGPSAGVIPCPQCQGSRIIYRHTPNLERFLNLRNDFFSRVRFHI